MSRAVFAKRSGVDPSTVYNIEKGKTVTLRTEQFERVAKLMGMDAETLRRETSSETAQVVLPAELADRIRDFAERRKMSVPDVFDLMLAALDEPPVKGSSSKTQKAAKQSSPPPPAPKQPPSPTHGGKA